MSRGAARHLGRAEGVTEEPAGTFGAQLPDWPDPRAGGIPPCQPEEGELLLPVVVSVLRAERGVWHLSGQQ